MYISEEAAKMLFSDLLPTLRDLGKSFMDFFCISTGKDHFVSVSPMVIKSKDPNAKSKSTGTPTHVNSWFTEKEGPRT